MANLCEYHITDETGAQEHDMDNPECRLYAPDGIADPYEHVTGPLTSVSLNRANSDSTSADQSHLKCATSTDDENKDEAASSSATLWRYSYICSDR